MAVQRTFSIIKPDAVAKNVTGKIVSRFESNGLKVVASRMKHLSRQEAEGFYAVHKDRPFFKDLVDFMVSGPVVLQVLEGEDAIAKNRALMGATDPKKAEPGTIRADFAESIDANAVHGSDAPETAAIEIAYFFPACEDYRPREKPARETAAAGGGPGARDQLRAHLGRRHAQVAVRRRGRQRHRNRIHPGRRSRYLVRVVAGRLRAGMHLLLDWAAGLQPQPDGCRDHRQVVGGTTQPENRAQPHHRRGRRAAGEQRGDDGHG